jgi:hypothetical protein
MKRNLLMMVVAAGALLATGALANAADHTVTPSDTTASQQSDMLITANVKGKLEGVALTQDYLVKAVFDARSVDGVVQVRNELSLQ